MSKEMFNNFKYKVQDFFLNPERNTEGERLPGVNKANVTAVLIAGFVGWLLLTRTVGAKLKKTLKGIPVLGGVLVGKTKATYSKARSRVKRTYNRRRKGM
jgi:hypothetical protein